MAVVKEIVGVATAHSVVGAEKRKRTNGQKAATMEAEVEAEAEAEAEVEIVLLAAGKVGRENPRSKQQTANNRTRKESKPHRVLNLSLNSKLTP
jgi:hypothetical protein